MIIYGAGRKALRNYQRVHNDENCKYEGAIWNEALQLTAV
jgi:hypothetical protein